MSLYHILLSTMLPPNTPPFHPDFQCPPPHDYAALHAYDEALLSHDLLDPFASASLSGPSTQYPAQSAWPQDYPAYATAPSASMSAHPWPPAAYQPDVYGQFAPGLQPEVHLSPPPMGYHPAGSMPQHTLPAQYPTPPATGQWSAPQTDAAGLPYVRQGRAAAPDASPRHLRVVEPAAAPAPRRSPSSPTTPARRRSPADAAAPDVARTPARAAGRGSGSSQTPCCWGGFCGASLDTLPIAGIAHHLKEAHLARGAWDGRARVVCRWAGGGAPCGMEMYCDNLGKHIAAVHLGSTALACPYCDKTFSRGDSLCRHVREACRHASP